MRDNVLITFKQAQEQFGISTAALRSWIAAGRLKPVRRQGRGRGGKMFFVRGEIAALVYGVCAGCGGGFKRERLKQRYCSKPCRQRAWRKKKG